MVPLVEFRSVSYRIGEREILRNVTLSVAPGESLVLLGRSGSGKTTLLRMVNRLVEPSSGEVLFDGRNLREWDPIRLRRRIGYVIQEAGLFPHRTVEQNVALVPELEGWEPTRIRDRVAELLKSMGLSPAHYASRRPRQLSGGERQRVGIARALAANPPLLLLDEPFAALDPVTRFELQRQFIELRRSSGATAMFVTHDVREALLVATRIAFLDHGNLDVVAAPDEFVRASSEGAQAFLATLTGDGGIRADG